jgi:hypothetical protein
MRLYAIHIEIIVVYPLLIPLMLAVCDQELR